MPYLEKSLRRQLASTIDKARLVAEEGAADAIRRLGVAEDAAPTWLSEADRLLRRTLRAHARSLGDVQVGSTLQGTTHLMETAAFEHWHRMLFGRFLVERGLLVHPTMGVVLERGELTELAAEEGLPDEWALVERIAAPALPAVFKPDDPALKLPLAPEYAKRLRDLVAGLPEAVFAAHDSLGWTYQFWRAAEKDRVNKAGGKIGAAELPVVTQLFTEPYMVRFLLHNTLGAWHAGRVLAANPTLVQDAEDESTLRAACALPGYEWEFLRFVREGDAWRPAAGTFPGWPETAAAVTVLDPCCGSGHFLTEALAALSALRRAEEGLTPMDGVAAVLRDNLHGLEIDGRCVQIAAFALALTAWRIGGATAPLPVPRVAWIGSPPPLPRGEFCTLANGNTRLRQALSALHDLFVRAPLLGSLLEVEGDDLIDSLRLAQAEGSMGTLLQHLRINEPERAEGVLAAQGMADAAAILGQSYVLQATNVPFLALSKAVDNLGGFIGSNWDDPIPDLYVAFLYRMRRLRGGGGAIAVVTPQNWYGLVGNQGLRRTLVQHDLINLICDLGPAAFEDMNWWAQRTALTIISDTSVQLEQRLVSAVDAESGKGPAIKGQNCSSVPVVSFAQKSFATSAASAFQMVKPERLPLLSMYAMCLQGVSTGDNDRLVRAFTEKGQIDRDGRWKFFQRVPEGGRLFSGLEFIVDAWTIVNPDVFTPALRGEAAWGKKGIIFGQMQHLPFGIYLGGWFSNSAPVMVPLAPEEDHLEAMWAFVSSGCFLSEMRKINRKPSVDNGYFTKVGFDLAYWQAFAADKLPDGPPKPYSDDPTQWLFHGHPAHAEPGTELHVALARLAGYRWPAETDGEIELSSLGRQRIEQVEGLPVRDASGLLPLNSHGGHRPLADRIRALLAAAYGTPPTPEQETMLVRAADAKCNGREARDASIETWLANRAFRQHCALFHDRPFLWQVWDGLTGGFSAFLNYHVLDAASLQTLIYTVLGDWINRQTAAGDTAREEAARRLQQTLVAIAQGEAPLDIFIRWKPLARQPIGWNPDLNDGVRLNIRPFMIAGVLREQPRGISWGKDRGTDVASAPWSDLGPQYGEKAGSRINDHHLTLAEKQAARTQAAAE